MRGKYHKTLTLDKWSKYSFEEQMGNIGSEVGRALKWREADDETKAMSAGYRALELFDLTLEDRKHYVLPGRLREIARAREVFVDFFFGDNGYHSTAQSLDSYFFNYAIAARQGR